MNKKISCIMVMLLCFGITTASFADVSGSGTFTPVIPGATYYSYPYSGNYYGYINELPGSYQDFYMTQSDTSYSGAGSLNGSSISGSHDSSTGFQTLSFDAVSHYVGQTTYANTNLIGRSSYSGVLNGNIGYDYTFTGLKNDAADPDDLLDFTIQMEIYYIEQINGAVFYRRAYSDYSPDVLSGGGFRSNWANHYNVDSGSYSGSIRFNYPDLGSHNWIIGWDFMGKGNDTTSGSSSSVPEPATMLLLGLGLMGLARVKRKILK